MSAHSPGCPPWAPPMAVSHGIETPVPEKPAIMEQIPDNPFLKLLVLLFCAILQRRAGENVMKCKKLLAHVLDCGDGNCSVAGCHTTRSLMRRNLRCDCVVSRQLPRGVRGCDAPGLRRAGWPAAGAAAGAGEPPCGVPSRPPRRGPGAAGAAAP
jgi:hypothetical protein